MTNITEIKDYSLGAASQIIPKKKHHVDTVLHLENALCRFRIKQEMEKAKNLSKEDLKAIEEVILPAASVSPSLLIKMKELVS